MLHEADTIIVDVDGIRVESNALLDSEFECSPPVLPCRRVASAMKDGEDYDTGGFENVQNTVGKLFQTLTPDLTVNHRSRLGKR